MRVKLLPFEYAVRNLGRSPRRLVGSILGATLVVVLVTAAAAFVRGMERSLRVSGVEQNVMLLGAGSEESVERSEIRAGSAAEVAATVAGIRSRLGVAYVSPEAHMAMVLKTDREAMSEFQAVLRGFTPPAFLVHPQVQMLEGRPPEPGADEIMVGRLAATRLGVGADALRLGRSLWFDNRPWKIVGRFQAPGTVMESEIWFPLYDLMQATRRETISTVIVTLGGAEFADVDAFAKQRLDLELVALRESEYYGKLLTFFGPIRAMVWVTAALVALGGLLGGLNTMYAAFASRVRELATLQTLGYSRPAIVLSMVQESLLVAAAGGLLATFAALLLLDGVAVRFSLGAFGLRVDAPVVLTGIVSGLLLGLIGALPPAWRCLRLPVTDALRIA